MPQYISLETISILHPLGEPGDPESLVLSRLPGLEDSEDVGPLGSVRMEEEGGVSVKEGGVTEVEATRFSLGGTGGTAPPASDRDRLRLGLVLPVWLGLRMSPGVGVAPEVTSQPGGASEVEPGPDMSSEV